MTQNSKRSLSRARLAAIPSFQTFHGKSGAKLKKNKKYYWINGGSIQRFEYNQQRTQRYLVHPRGEGGKTTVSGSTCHQGRKFINQLRNLYEPYRHLTSHLLIIESFVPA